MRRIKFYEAIAAVILLSLTVFAGISCSKAQADSNQALESTTWVLKSYGNPDSPTPAADRETTLTFNKDKKTVGGSGGVNGYGGDYDIDGSKLTVSGIIHTLIAVDGPIMGQENAFFKILDSAQSYNTAGKQLTITGTEGILVFSSK